MNTAPGNVGGRYWLLIGDAPNGPFDITQIHAKLMAGTITWQTQACPVGENTWLPLVSVPGLGPSKAPAAVAIQTALPADEPLDVLPAAFTIEPIPRSSAPFSRFSIADEETRRQKFARAWNPVVIAWLGLIFSPVWAGIMAALNGRRLGLSLPVWRPITIGVGSLLLALASGAVVDSYWVDALLYLGALGLIWLLDLRPQAKAYLLHLEQPRKAAGWVVPVQAGLPAAAMVFFAFVVAPLIPLEPRQVCEKFNAAKTEKEMKKYTTINLWPALAVLAQQADADDSGDFELTDEGPAPEEIGGYLVGFRGMFKDGKEHNQIEGLFHLVHWEEEWKIEDIYITFVNRQPLDKAVSMAKDYQQLAASSNKPRATAVSTKPPSSAQQTQKKGENSLNSATARSATRGVAGIVSWLLHDEGKPISKAGKTIGAVLLAVVAGLCRFGKGLLGFLTSGARDEQKSA
jgi:hypothetical protein